MAWALGREGDRIRITIEGNPLSRAQVERLRDALSDWLEPGRVVHAHQDVAAHASQHSQVDAWISMADARFKALEERVFDERARAPEGDDLGWPEIVLSFLERVGGKR